MFPEALDANVPTASGEFRPRGSIASGRLAFIARSFLLRVFVEGAQQSPGSGYGQPYYGFGARFA